MDVNNKNFIKKTNASQFQKLVELMEQYPQLATGSPVFGSSKVSAEEKWSSIAVQINALGPPVRSGLEWKRVWQDQKCRLKKKIAENNKNLHCTGGGPCTVINLTALEQNIDRICHLTSAAAPSGTVLGLQSECYTHKIKDLEPPLANLEPQSVPQQINKTQQKHNTTPPSSPSKTSRQNRKRKRDENSTERQTFVREQINMQKKTLEIMNKQAEAAQEQAKALKEIATTSNAIGKSLIELIKYLKDED